MLASNTVAVREMMRNSIGLDTNDLEPWAPQKSYECSFDKAIMTHHKSNSRCGKDPGIPRIMYRRCICRCTRGRHVNDFCMFLCKHKPGMRDDGLFPRLALSLGIV